MIEFVCTECKQKSRMLGGYKMEVDEKGNTKFTCPSCVRILDLRKEFGQREQSLKNFYEDKYKEAEVSSPFSEDKIMKEVAKETSFLESDADPFDLIDSSKYITLTKTYRSTDKIIDYTNKILGLNHVTAIRNNNASDIIFEYVVEQDFKKELTLFLKEFEDNILKRILSTYKIKNIARIGFIIMAQLDSSDTLLSDVSVLVKKHYNENPDEALSLRFNIVKKQPLKIGKVTTEDYDNTIVTYDKANKEAAITFTVDYQKYFSPVLERIADSPISFSDFCGKCFSNYEKKYGKKEE